MTGECPCCSGRGFALCCGPFLNGDASAPTAEALMRSRYTAFATRNAAYLADTLAPEARSAGEGDEIVESLATREWLNLIILDVARGGAGDRDGFVDFVAVSRAKRLGFMAGGGGSRIEPVQMHERSFFRRDAGRWYYVEGEMRPDHKPKPNAPCWCGSGRKFKLCHG